MDECRICLEEENENDFIKPCGCSAQVHRGCIKNWILSENNNSPTDCEVCLNKYSIDFAEMFAEQLSRANRSHSENSIISISNNNDFDSNTEEDTDDISETNETTMDVEIGNVDTNQIVPREMTSTERLVVTRIVLSRLSRRDRVITERIIGGTLVVSVLDGFLLFVYFAICRFDHNCRMEVMSVGIAGTLLALFPLLYNGYLKWSNGNIRRDLVDPLVDPN